MVDISRNESWLSPPLVNSLAPIPFVIPRRRPANRVLEARELMKLGGEEISPMFCWPSSLPLHPITITAVPVSTTVGMKELIEATFPRTSTLDKKKGEETRSQGD